MASLAKGKGKAPPGKTSSTAPAKKPAPKEEPAEKKAETTTKEAPVLSHKRSYMEQEFDRLKALDKLEEGVDAIGPKGLQQLCGDLGIAFNEFDMFVLVTKIGATQSYCITRSEWLHGMFDLKINETSVIKTKIVTWRNEYKEDELKFTEMYFNLYDFIRGEEEKLLPAEKAIKAWQVLLPEPNPFAFLSYWVQWVTVEYKRNITRDVWRQVWEFARRIKSLDTYDPNDKWPTALDDFVEWAKEKTGPKKPASP